MASQDEARAREERWRERMAAAQRGDAAAYEELLTEILPVLRAFVRSRLRNETWSEDVVQNVLLSIHRARHTYRPERPFGPWLRAVARNAVVDFRRRYGRRAGREVALRPEEGDLADEAKAPAPIAQHELSPELSRALRALPATQREAVELLHLHGLSTAEAAVRAGVTPGALKVRAHRGYRALRARLRGEAP